MPKWRLAKSLIKLRAQIDAASPHRSKVSDGSIGDASHAAKASASDHNPSNGVVHAIDITHDPAHGIYGHALSGYLTKDPRIKYVIFDGQIWKARTGKKEKYTGSNPHSHHVHVSVKTEWADDDAPWTLGTLTVEPVKPKYNDPVEFVREFQRVHGLTVDGIAGPKSWAALGK